MSSLVNWLRQDLGNLVDTVGGRLGIPETGISEKIAGGSTVNSSPTPQSYASTAPTAPQMSYAPYSPAPYPTNNTTTNNTTTNTTLAPTQDTGGWNQADYNKTWYYNEFGQPTAINQGGSSTPDLLGEINKEFDNILGGIGGQQQEAQGFISNATNLQKQGIQEQLGYGQANLENQRGQVRENQANTLSDLAKSLRDSSRNVQMMLGGRGATGSANDHAAYALTKLYGNQRAGVQQQSNSQMNDISTAENNLKASASSMLNDVDTWANSQMSSISDQYNQLRNNIGTMKASARLEEIGRLQAEASSIRQMQQQYQMAIQDQARQRLMQLNDYKAQLGQMSQYTPEQQVYREVYANPMSYSYDEGFNLNPLALARKKEEKRI